MTGLGGHPQRRGEIVQKLHERKKTILSGNLEESSLEERKISRFKEINSLLLLLEL